MGNETAGTQSVPTPVKGCEGGPTPPPSTPRFGPHLGRAGQDGGEFGKEQVLNTGLGLQGYGGAPLEHLPSGTNPTAPGSPPGTTPGPTHSTPGDQF